MSQDRVAVKTKQLEKVKSLRPRDRLDRVGAMALMDQYILDSCQGWAQCIINPTLINRFNEEELKEIYEQFKEIALEFLEFEMNTLKKLIPSSKKKGGMQKTTHYT